MTGWEPAAIAAELRAHEFRIYGDDREMTYVVVDPEDYWYFSQWRWEPNYDRHGRKLYLRRSVGRGAISRPLYLHVAIHRRRGIAPPSPQHTIVDHRNGNEVDCRKSNLRWATPSENRRNIRGVYQ